MYYTVMEYWLCYLGMLPWCIWELCTPCTGHGLTGADQDLAPVMVYRPMDTIKIHGPITSYLCTEISYYLFAEL